MHWSLYIVFGLVLLFVPYVIVILLFRRDRPPGYDEAAEERARQERELRV